MANPISPELVTGTLGELLVQMRLLQHNVQAAPPLKDSGNDLVALKGEAIRTIQVKTTTDKIPAWPAEDKLYHLLAIVRLRGEGHNLLLDESDIYLIPKQSLGGLSRIWDSLSEFRITPAHVETLFQPSK